MRGSKALLAGSLCFLIGASGNTYAEAFLKIALGNGHSCAITQAGGLKCWGLNQNGQLGDGSLNQSNVPVDVIGLSSGVESLALGDGHTCALTSAGAVKCWGRNISGQLGDGSTTRSSIPVAVVGLESGVIALAAGGPHSCALTSGGAVKCWGDNGFGELGVGSTTPTSSNVPLAVAGLSSGVSDLALGWGHSCVRMSNAAVKCWGWNPYGQLGDGTTGQREAPVNVIGLSGGALAVSSGDWHSCVVTPAGGVKCWGANGGRLGDGSTGNRSTPGFVSGLSSGVSAVAAGSFHSCALTSLGAVKCWGMNSSGELGNGTTNQSGVPVSVIGLSSGITAVALGNSHSCALTWWGAVKCWGDNEFGSLGNGETTDSSTPVAVFGAPPEPSPSPTATPSAEVFCSLKVGKACSPPRRVAKGTRCQFSAMVRDRQSMAGIEGASVSLERRYGKKSWISIRSGLSAGTGAYLTKLKVSRTASYRSLVNQGACLSRSAKVLVK